MTSKTTNKFSPEVRARAVRLVLDHEDEHTSRWAAVLSIAAKIGCTAQTLHEWVKKAERDSGVRSGVASDVTAKLKALERENRELRQANQILRKASAYFAMAELDRRFKPGEINHQGKSYKGEHQATIDLELFEAVQAPLSVNRQVRPEDRLASDALLTGRLYDDRGNRMSPTYALKKGVRYRYYVSTALVQGQRHAAGTIARVAANEIENAVLTALRERYSLQRKGGEQQDDRGLAERHLSRVVLRKGSLELAFKASEQGTGEDAALETTSLPWSPPSSIRKRDLLLPSGNDSAAVRPMKVENRTRLPEGDPQRADLARLAD